MSALTATALTSSAVFAGGHSKDIVDTAVAAGSFTTLVAAVKAADLVDVLKGEGPFTVFAPTAGAIFLNINSKMNCVLNVVFLYNKSYKEL